MDERAIAIKTLRELGLSEYAARAYDALLQLGRADAKAISTLARVPPSKVYEVLATLEDNGLLQVFPEFPKQYGAVSLAPYLDKLQRSHLETAQRIEVEREELLRRFTPTPTGEDATRVGEVMVLRGGTRIFERVRTLLQGCDKSWLVLGSLGTLSRYTERAQDLQDARARGVTMRFLLPEAKHGGGEFTLLARYADIRRRILDGRTQGEHVAIIVADDAQAMLIHWGASDAGSAGAADVAIFTDEKAMVGALASLVEALWVTAPPLAA